MSIPNADNSFISLGGNGYKLPTGATVFQATDSITSSIRSISETAQQEKMAAGAGNTQISDSCGGGGNCGRDASYVMLDVRRTKIPKSTGVFELNTGMGWMNSTQTFYENARFTAPRTLCCTNDFPIHERPELCCDTTNIATYYMAWRSCIHEHRFICGGDNGYQEWNPEEARLQQTAVESMALFASLLAFNGSAENNLIGLANNPRIMDAPMPSLLTSPPSLIMSALANVMSLLRMWESITVTADGNYTPQTYLWLIPSMFYDPLSVRLYEGQRLIDWISGGSCCNTTTNTNRPTYKLQIVPIPELNAHGVDGRPTGYIMKYGDLEWVRPYFTLDGAPDRNGSPYSILPPQQDGLFRTTIAWFRAGSVAPKDLTGLVRTRF